MINRSTETITFEMRPVISISALCNMIGYNNKNHLNKYKIVFLVRFSADFFSLERVASFLEYVAAASSMCKQNKSFEYLFPIMHLDPIL